MKNQCLTAEDRGFLELVSRAAFVNPFSDERIQLDLRMGGLQAGARAEDRIEAALGRLAEFLAKLDRSGRAHLGMFEAADRVLVRTAFLFEVFHRFYVRFDDLILGQIRAQDALCKVPFCAAALHALSERGFSPEEAARYFGIFYQIRRAYYFIDRALLGGSACMKQLRRSLWNNVFTSDTRWYDRHMWDRMEDFSTLLLGETGTGKGTAATAIGRSGFIPFDAKRECFIESFLRSFVAINLSQYPESLIESELFGHRKGAFTGAVEAHEGVLARCSPHGAIFLDEIGDVPVPVQVKLLQVLEERVFSPVGSHKRQSFRGRVIAATNKPLSALRREGKFRDDFFYRLCSDIIVVPPLRQRIAQEPGELDALLAHTVAELVGEPAADVVAMVREVIDRDVGADYGWPGNVRELWQCVRRILLARCYAAGGGAAATSVRDRLLAGVEAGSYEAGGLLADYCALLYERHGTYEAVANRTGLDRRTAKKYIVKAHTPAADPAPGEA